MKIRELDPEHTHLAYEAMRELRPHVADPATFIALVNDHLRPQGYRLVVAVDHTGTVAAAMGLRRGESLSWGDHVYVDDLVTLPSYRRRGYARALLDWARTEAERLGCGQLHLDSASHRHDAHRLYLRWGMDIVAFHFASAVEPGPR
jgi:GNAT superfamily N-acetyltransferase